MPLRPSTPFFVARLTNHDDDVVVRPKEVACEKRKVIAGLFVDLNLPQAFL